MAKKSIEIQSKTTRQLLEHVQERRFAIPKLQREFVWDGPKAAKLVDSIYKQMPIGVLMIWETLRSKRLFLRQSYHILPPFDPKNSRVWFLIDGQQRVSVLHHVREGGVQENAKGRKIDFRRVVFFVAAKEGEQAIRYRRPISGQYESMADILHPEWRSRLNHLGTRPLRRVAECRRRIMSYPLYLMYVHGKLDTIRESFLRINTQGMKISTADAIFTGAEALDLRDIRHEVNQSVSEGFGQIGEMPILFAMSAVRGGSEARGEALRGVIRKLERQANGDKRMRRKLADEWHRLARCFGKSVDYLRQHFDVLIQDFLYSDYMVAMLALFFFWNSGGPSLAQKERITAWFWATAVGSRYSGNNFNRCIPEDVRFFKKLADDPRTRFVYEPQVDPVDVRKSQYSAKTGITTAFYCMLLSKRPVNLLDRGLNPIPREKLVTKANRKNRHHIFPRVVLANAGVSANLYNSICNICLLTAEENQSISSKRPRQYLWDVYDTATYFRKKMRRHLIPAADDSGVWDTDVKRGFRRFARERTELICRELESRAGIRLFRKGL